jgi:NAD(P)-dependent dehydrogenase (short-subunit alcohol dehydrogenase family)
VTILAANARGDELLVVELEATDDDAATGVLAERLTTAFAAARDGARTLPEHGCVVFVVRGGDAARAGIASLTRTLALEWAPRRIRVNAICGDETGELVRFVASPASRMLTGAVLSA